MTCTRCGQRPPAPDSKMCETCQAYCRQQKRRARAKAQNMDLCSLCAKRPPTPGYKTCEACRRYERERKHPKSKPLELIVTDDPADIYEMMGLPASGLQVRGDGPWLEVV